MNTPNIDSSPLLRAVRDALWDRERLEEGRLKKRQITRWIEEQEAGAGALWDQHVGPFLDQIQDAMRLDLCRNCGEPTEGGEGWDGLCGNCADREARRKGEV